jgi:hypothetical protein
MGGEVSEAAVNGGRRRARLSRRAPLLFGLVARVVHLLGLDGDEALYLGEHSEQRQP